MNILASIGIHTNQTAINGTIRNITNVKQTLIDVGNVTKEVTDEISALSKAGKFTALSAGLQTVFSGISDIAGKIKESVSGLYDFADKYAANGDKIAKTSKLIGMSSEDFQALSFSAERNGISNENFTSALKKMSLNLAKAKSGEAKELRAFSNSIFGEDENLEGLKKLSSTKDVLLALAEGFKKFKTEEDRVFAASEIFGKSGTQMSLLLSQGAPEIEKLVKQFKDLGGGFTDDGAERAELFADELSNAKVTIESIKVIVASELFDVVKDLFGFVQTFFKENKDEVISVSKQIGSVLSNSLRVVFGVLKMITPIVIKLLGIIGPKITLIVAGLLSIAPAIASIVIGLSVVGPLISGMLPILGVAFGWIALIVAAVVSWGSVIMDVYDNWDMLKSFIVDDVWGSIKKTIGNAWDWFKSVFVDPFVNLFKNLPEIVSQAWEGFKNGVASVGKFIYDSFFGAISGAINAAKGLLSSLPLVGGLFSDSSVNASNSVSSADASRNASNSVASAAASVIRQSSVTTTNRFAVDFSNVPRGTQITPPEQGDFDWSRSYTFAGAV